MSHQQPHDLRFARVMAHTLQIEQCIPREPNRGREMISAPLQYPELYVPAGFLTLQGLRTHPCRAFNRLMGLSGVLLDGGDDL